MARPTIKTPEIVDTIVARIAEGETLRAICRDEQMPSWQTVYLWKEKDEDFNRRFAYAREVGHDAIAENTIEIADEHPGRVDNGGTDSGAVAHAKLRIETRLKLLSKWSPKKYGDKQAVELTGKDEGPLLVEHKASAIAVLLEKAAQRKLTAPPAEQDADLA